MSFSWRDEFPTYPRNEMPELPSGAENWDFVDTSWRNNACPSFTSDKLGLHLWIDFPNPDDREHKGVARFILERQDRGIETGESVVETENWDDVIAAIRAEAK